MPAPKPARSPAELGPVTRSEVVRILRVAPTTVDAWKRADCPQTRVGNRTLYPIHELVTWLVDRAKSEAAPSEDVIDLNRVRDREARARMELAELALKEARGDVVPLDLVVELVDAEYGNAAAKLGTLVRYAGRLAKCKSTAKAKGILQEAIRGTRGELSSGPAIAERAREGGRGAKRVKGAARRIS